MPKQITVYSIDELEGEAKEKALREVGNLLAELRMEDIPLVISDRLGHNDKGLEIDPSKAHYSIGGRGDYLKLPSGYVESLLSTDEVEVHIRTRSVGVGYVDFPFMGVVSTEADAVELIWTGDDDAPPEEVKKKKEEVMERFYNLVSLLESTYEELEDIATSYPEDEEIIDFAEANDMWFLANGTRVE